MIPAFRPLAERGVLADFAGLPPDRAEAAVQALDRALTARPCPGLIEAVPAFTTLAVLFDPLVTDHAAVTAHLVALCAAPIPPAPPNAPREVEVTYDGPDLAEVARRTGLTEAAVAAAHLAARFHVVMYGFAPGYAYLGGLPEALALDRKPAPVRDVPAGSVIIAGRQCLVTTLTMPTGWWIIGHSPTRILTGDPARPFLFDVGDDLRFRRARSDG